MSAHRFAHMLQRRGLRLGSTLDGAGRVLDLGSRPQTRVRRTSTSDDAEALRGDWEAIGRDFRSAVDRADKDLAEQ